ncbi:MAG: BamA/TamA family outer membrane protein [Bacteroidia bacterium]|nr:BamA/TamA family outer membrane protein [Bacteroidia bacterium]
MDYNRPTSYLIGGIKAEGNLYLDDPVIVVYSNLSIGQTIKIPGTEISNAIENLWKQEYFSEIMIYAGAIKSDTIYLVIKVKERPQLAAYNFPGLSRSESQNLKDELDLKGGVVINENLLNRTKTRILEYYYEKGYYNTEVDIKLSEPTADIKVKNPAKPNTLVMRIYVKKGKKVKVEDILFVGNDKVETKILRKAFKKTKSKKHKLNIFASSKFVEEKYDEEKNGIVKKYYSLGYRDAKLVFDSIYKINNERIIIKIAVSEGKKYYFRHINFTGNIKHPTEDLSNVLNIKKGDIYDQTILEERLFNNPSGYDITSLYMDDGYLFFNVVPLEVKVEDDSIDIDIHISEGPQAIYNKITVIGNTKTSDHVILRELRTRPGEKFSRADIQRSLRELSQIGYFNPEALNVNPKPNAATGTVDIEYTVEEKASDQIELSGGWGGNNRSNSGVGNGSQGGYGGLVGTLGLTLNNFSSRKLLHPSLWNPIPSGDGQRLSLRAQSNGIYYQSYNASFSEPWLGGKKPNSFSFSIYRTNQSYDNLKRDDPLKQFIKITGANISLGKRIKWPDDYFSLLYSVGFQQYHLQNAAGAYGLSISNGRSNSLEFKWVISRNSVDAPIFSTSGSRFEFSIAATPPVSAFSNKDYAHIAQADKFKFVEYHKWKFDIEHYVTIKPKLVFMTKARFGYLGYYNKFLNTAPFERFVVGGSGLNSFGQIGSEIISMRGYTDRTLSLNAAPPGSSAGAAIFNKYTAEIRYAISTNPSATIFTLAFVEAGNAWLDPRKYNPFEVKRSAGVGIRLFLPMFGLLGLDYAYGFDWRTIRQSAYTGTYQPKQLHFFIGQQF